MDHAEKILMESLDKVRVAARYRMAARSWRSETSWRTRKCPGCHDGLHVRTIPGTGSLLVCPRCSFTFEVKEELNEGRLPGEGYGPGITGKSTPTVILDSSGKIKHIRDL